MYKLGQLLTATFLFLLAPPSFAANLWISIPQDEHIDPASSQTLSVRPGDKVSLVAALYDSTNKDLGHRAEEFEWQPGCDSSSPACPTVSMSPGSVVVTVNVPICFPVGTTHISVIMPVPPQGEGAPSPARVSLTNTEQPSICPGGRNPRPGDVAVSTMAIHSHPETQAAQARAATEQGGRSGGAYGGQAAAAEQARREQLRREYEQAYYEAHQYSNNSQRGYNHGDADAGSAVVMSCGYRGNKLRCRQFVPMKKKPVRKAVKTKRVVRKRGR